MQQHAIPGLINFKKLNPYIKLEKSPFMITTEPLEWRSDNREPLTAALNSFGHSGTNVHLVIQEYMEPQTLSSQSLDSEKGKSILIPVSAKNEDRLKEYLNDFLKYLKNSYPDNPEQKQTADLGAIAYTMQTGREAMEVRVVFIVRNIAELKSKLEAYLNGQEGIENFWQGDIKDGKNTVSLFDSDEDMQETVGKWYEKGKYNKIAELWIQGFEVDWESFYKGNRPRRVSLPTYPFAEEHYWKPEEAEPGINRPFDPAKPDYLHPLLHKNISNFEEEKFSSVFYGEEFFFSDHIINGRKLLPAVAYLEMARAAVSLAAGFSSDSISKIALKNIVWAIPIAAGEKTVHVNTSLVPAENGEILFDIFSLDSNKEPIIHSQGSAEIVKVENETKMDLKNLRDRNWEKEFSSEEWYGLFEGTEINYGPAHKGIETLYAGDGKVLARLSLPSTVRDNSTRFVLHPSIMDSALQASIGLAAYNAQGSVVVPFALDEVLILDSCVQSVWVSAQFNRDNNQKIDIDLCDDTGTISVRIKGLSMRSMTDKGNYGLLMLEPEWKEEPAAIAEAAETFSQRIIFLCEPDGIETGDIEQQIKGSRLINLTTKDMNKGIAERYQDYAEKMIREIQTVLENKPEGEILIQVVIFPEEEKCLFTGLIGILRTVRQENPLISSQLIEMDPIGYGKSLAAKIEENTGSLFNNRIMYKDGKRYVETLKEVSVDGAEPGIPWKEKGIYLITGGAGGLGRIFAKDIAGKTKGPILILTGRSPIDDEKKAFLQELEEQGAMADYRQVDVTKKEAVESMMKKIGRQYGNLTGIIHSAGIIRDSYILKKNIREVREVLGPKVKGVINLDIAAKDMNLDMFILFSSITGVVGNAGQADYSAANAFMDAFAKFRNNEVSLNRRRGKTISIDWPLWEEGGMVVDEENKKILSREAGIFEMKTLTGISVLHHSLALDKNQIIAVEGNLAKIKKILLAGETPSVPAEDKSENNETVIIPEIEKEKFQDKAVTYFKNLLSSTLRIPPGRIEADAPFEKYGIDSIMVIQLTTQLEKVFGSLSKTLFFEYKDLKSLTEYFLKKYQKQLIEILETGERSFAVKKEQESVKIKIEDFKYSTKKLKRRGIAEFKETGKALDVAIIGVSGRYPKANNIAEFWNNLKNGIDCITEISKDRWDWQEYLEKSKNSSGKSYSKWGGFIDGADEFDPLFFNISPREAIFMDPQERVFLECAYNTLEDAGYTRESLDKNHKPALGGKVGVYVGVMYEEYQLYAAQEQSQGRMFALGGNPSSIANRVSYVFDFQGPSMAIDTMCSSSLTTIHLACQSILRGECSAAIAGGVNLSIHPNKFILLAQGNFASSKGRCESFGKGGDGYVPSEGVGAVLLKPLPRAVADGDHIYGIIKGSAINSGGKTNGYTVPNPIAQEELIKKAIENSGVNARSISYIEAHGTGTSLGDPIEITGITRAFRHFTEDKNFCAIGSVKSNIGHAESAAGIAAITKVLLQLKHRQLVPSLHSKELNPNIDFSQTPFVVQQELSEWKSNSPRLAGVSSFGAGGASAHIIIEEHIAGEAKAPLGLHNEGPAAIVLSAKKEQALKARAKDLLSEIKKKGYRDDALSEIAYTLQIGREAMDERLGFTARTIKECEEKLQAFVEGKEGTAGIYVGKINRTKDNSAAITSSGEAQKILETFINQKNYEKILEVWVDGLKFDWDILYNGNKPRKLSLPTYPFTKKKYWLKKETEEKKKNPEPTTVTLQHLHPLLHENTSDFEEQRFSSEYRGDELFFSQHLVNKQNVLPAAVYIEMARSAVQIASGNAHNDKVKIRFKNLRWGYPVVAGTDPVKLNIGLVPDESGEIIYEVYSGKHDGEVSVYNQGTAQVFETDGVPGIDLKTLREHKWARMFGAAESYAALTSIGIEYGEWYRGIEALYEGRGQGLAKLKIPDSVGNYSNRYVLHPAIIDSAMQSFIMLMLLTNNGSAKVKIAPSMPLLLDELEVYNLCVPKMWAFTRYNINQAAQVKADIVICDESGNVNVHMKGLHYDADMPLPYAPKAQPVKKNLPIKQAPEKVDTAAPTYFSAKPGNISLNPLAEVEVISPQPAAPVKPVNNALQEAGSIALKNSEDIPASSGEKLSREHVSERDILEYLTESLAEALYIEREELDPDKVFTEMGMDSIIAVEWIKAINNKYGSAVAATKIYEHPNVRDLAGFMVKELNENTIDIIESRLEPELIPPVKPEQTLMPDAAKPGNISLSPVTEAQVFSPQPAAPVKPVNNALQEAGSIALKNSEDIPASSGEKFSREHISERDILEYLTESLAEALYIEREELDPDKIFTELGMDSIIAVEWIKAINNKYGINVAATKVYDHPNLSGLAGFLAGQFNKDIE
jgi:polyketide synthase PksN